MLEFAIVLAILCASTRLTYLAALYLDNVHRIKVANTEAIMNRAFVLEVAAIVCGIIGLVR